MSKHCTREKKTILLLLPHNISVNEELVNVADVGVNFYKSKFKTNTIHKSKNGNDFVWW